MLSPPAAVTPLTDYQAEFLNEFANIKNEIELELVLREMFVADAEYLSHRLPVLGPIPIPPLVQGLLSRMRKEPKADERLVILRLCEQLELLDKTYDMVKGCERNVEVLRLQGMKLQTVYMMKLV